MNKTIISLIIGGILLISIPVGVRLVQTQQTLKSRANESCPVDGGYFWDGSKCIHKTGGSVWEDDNQCHYNFDEVPGTETNCPGTTRIATPPPETVANPAPSGSVATQCNGTKPWAEIWNGLVVAGWNATKPWDSSAALVKYNELSCGGSCTLGSQSPNLTEQQVGCILGKRPNLVEDIKKAKDPNNPSNLNICSNLQLINFWCNGGISTEASDQCADDKKACASGGTGAGGGLSCNVTVPGSVARGGNVAYEVTIPDSSKSSDRILELTYNIGQLEKEVDWLNKITCNTASAQPCKGEFSTTSIPSNISQIQVKCDVRPADPGVEISAGNACSGNPLLGNVVGGINPQFPNWVSCGVNSHKTITLTAVVAPTPISTPTPTPVAACDVNSTQARMRLKNTDAWRDDLSISLGDTVAFAGFYDGQTETPAPDVDIEIEGPLTKSNSRKVPPPPITKNSDNTFSYKVPDKDGIGDYKVTVVKKGKSGDKCTGKGTLHVSGPATTTEAYRVGESLGTGPESVFSAQYKPYTAEGLLVSDFTFKDRNPGQKFVYVEFKDSNGKEGGCGTNKDEPCRMPITLINSAQAASCSLTFDGSATVINLQGQNFGTSAGRVTGSTQAGTTAGTALSVTSWIDTNVVANWSSAPKGKTLFITLTTASGQQTPVTCSAVSQLAVDVNVFCQAVSERSTPNVDLTLQDATTGEILVNQKVTIDADGLIRGLNVQLIADKKYVMSLKAPKSLRRNREFTASKLGGVTNIQGFKLPMGDIAGKGDGRINPADYSQLKRDWNIGGDAAGRVSDLDLNARVNSRDWACLRPEIGLESDPELVPGVALVNPNATPLPGQTVTPAPGQPGVCTLGMYVKFEGLNNATIPSVNLVLFPPSSDPTLQTECRAENGCRRFNNVSVAPATNPAINNANQDVFLITNGSNSLSCGENFNVVVLSSGFKQSIFRGVTVTDDPARFPILLFNNNLICKTTSTSCNNNCLRSDPVCVTP